MALGLGPLHLSSKNFWQMTPREFERALAGVFGDARNDPFLDRGALNDLMRRYPDQTDAQT